MLVHKITGFGVFRIEKGNPIFKEYFPKKNEAEEERDKYEKTFGGDNTRVYAITILADIK